MITCVHERENGLPGAPGAVARPMHSEGPVSLGLLRELRSETNLIEGVGLFASRRCGAMSVPVAAMTNYHKLSGLNNRNLFPPSSGN